METICKSELAWLSEILVGVFEGWFFFVLMDMKICLNCESFLFCISWDRLRLLILRFLVFMKTVGVLALSDP